MDVCPKNIPIPEIFAYYNKYLAAKITRDVAKENFPTTPIATDCIKCGKCEKTCPQVIPIRKHLEDVSKWYKDE
jgi:predicted aldo/keto reductase-like oxidoreductase